MRRLFIALLVVVILIPTAAFAQYDTYMELLRSDISTQRVAIFTEVLGLSDAESEAFWPVYRTYETELAAVTDTRIALIKNYAASYDSMTNEKASELMMAAFKVRDDRTKIHKKYMKEFQKILPATTVARFFQTEYFITAIIDLQISAELPLVETVQGATEKSASQ